MKIALADHCLSEEGDHCAVLMYSLLEADPELLVLSSIRATIDHPNIKKTFRFANYHKKTAYPSTLGKPGLLNKIKGRLGWIRAVAFANIAYYKDLKQNLSRSEPTILIATNVDIRQLIGLLAFVLSSRRHIRLATYFTVAPLKSLALVRPLLRLAPSGTCSFFAENQPMANRYSEYLSFPCKELIFPIQAKHPLPAYKPSEKPSHLVFVGHPRKEKGIDLLAPALDMLTSYLEKGEIKISVQIDEKVMHDDGMEEELESFKAHALKYEGMKLIEGPLILDEHYHLLESADLVLLPYRKSAYGKRGSLIPVECLFHGKPIVFVPELFGSSMAEEYGAVYWMKDEDAHSLADAIRRYLDEREKANLLALERAEEFRKKVSPESYLHTILESVQHPKKS